LGENCGINGLYKKEKTRQIWNKNAKPSRNTRLALRALFAPSGFEKPQPGCTPFVRFSLTHIPAHRIAAQCLLDGLERRQS
jgi:hypothetical protein